MDWKLQTGQDMGNEGCTRRPSLVVWSPVKHLRSRIVRSHPGWLGQQSFTARGEKFFFLSGFSYVDTDNSQGIVSSLFLSTISTHSETFTDLFASLDMRWLPCKFSRTTCNYQTVTQWGLLPCWITIWLFKY